MLRRFNDLRRAIRLFLQDHQPDQNEKFFDIIKDSLISDDWKEIELFIDLLKPFEYLTRKLQGNFKHEGSEGSHECIYETIPSLQRLFVHLEKKIEAVPQYASNYYQECLLLGKEKLDHYWDIIIYQTPFYIAAAMVHPSLNLAWFKNKWQKYQSWVNHSKKLFEDFFKSWAKQRESAEENDQNSELNESDESELEQPSKRRRRNSVTSINSEEAEFDDVLTVNHEYIKNWSSSLLNESSIQAELSSWLRFIPGRDNIKVSS